MTGKEKCELLRIIRKQIAEMNGIEYKYIECKHEGDCSGTCPRCDAEIRYLDEKINKKAMAGEKVTVSSISADAIEKLIDDQLLDAYDVPEEDLDWPKDMYPLMGMILPREGFDDEE